MTGSLSDDEALSSTDSTADFDQGSTEVSNMDLALGRPVKRSFSVAGHRTSISLEAAFWDAFRELCAEDDITMAARLAEIDRVRGSTAGLSGTVRVWILQRYRLANRR